MKILITGANGYIGTQLVQQLLARKQDDLQVIGTDLRKLEKEKEQVNYQFYKGDLSKEEVKELILEHCPDCVVHLAAIVVRPKGMTREAVYEVEVEGTKKILEACVQAKVKKIITTSSGAAYGYHEDNAAWLTEEMPLRGNQEFAYAWHKRLVEEMMADYRCDHPELQQVILRVSTILGKTTDNDITNLFHKKSILGLRGSATPFVIIWDKDLVRILEEAILKPKEGIFNVAGDGIITMKEIATLLQKRYLELPASVVKFILGIAKPLKLVRYGPEQVKFLQYRPVLDNQKLKEKFGYEPRKTSKEVFLYYAKEKGLIL